MDRPALGKLALAVALCALATGCPLPPPPASDELHAQALANTQVPAQWTAGPVDAGEVTDGWLATFHDPALEAIVAEAMTYNADLKVAAARVEAAEANLHGNIRFQPPELGAVGATDLRCGLGERLLRACGVIAQ